jgi:hypothetical protein
VYNTLDAVSGDGSVIVGGGDGAMIWTADDGPRRLKDVLQDDFGLDLFGWTLTEARGISSDGSAIVGLGINPFGAQEAWLAPPRTERRRPRRRPLCCSVGSPQAAARSISSGSAASNRQRDESALAQATLREHESEWYGPFVTVPH